MFKVFGSRLFGVYVIVNDCSELNNRSVALAHLFKPVPTNQYKQAGVHLSQTKQLRSAGNC